ncbi:MAG: alpha/beta hydrolase [Oscillospiraceae bacterium]|nr:alpha/beta hydrolase [Oscillospiraceae bacterium]
MSLGYKMIGLFVKKVKSKKQYEPSEEEMLSVISEKFRAKDVPEFLYKRFNAQKTDINGQPLFKISPKNGSNGKVILFLHGGGGMMCPTVLHYRMASDLVRQTGADLYFPFYPLAPEATVTDSIFHIKKVYDVILKEHNSENITVIGDSAGAVLSVSVCGYTDKKPNGVVLISPGVGMEKNDGKMEQMEPYDAILSMKTINLIKKYWLRGVDIKSPEINVTSRDYTGFPPMMLYYGTKELFYPYIDELIERITECGVSLEVHEGKDMCHDWAIADVIPEGRKAIREISAFVRSVT